MPSRSTDPVPGDGLPVEHDPHDASDPRNPSFHVTPFEHKPGDGQKVIFLVQTLDTGEAREIVVTKDAMGFYEFTVNGSEYLDVEATPLYLTVSLIDTTDRMLQKALIAAYEAFSDRFAINDEVH